ncbi:MAG: histidine kinase [Bacteroidota bacterium]
MLSLRKVTYYAFIGATLLFVLPFLLFTEISTSGQVNGFLLQFITGWAFLGISIYYHFKFYLRYKKRSYIFWYSCVLFLVIATIDVFINLALEDIISTDIPGHAPIVEETIIQDSILTFISLGFVYRFFQRKRNEENNLRIVKLENENLQLQLNSLQQQLNPHFFFNSLNTLSELIYIDVEKSEFYINKLSQVFRYILDMQGSTFVTLDRELKFIQSYFFLLKIRYDDKLNLHGDIADPEQYKIPSLSLLVLFENVIKHNAISVSKPMNIYLELGGGYLSVKNNKNLLPKVKQHSFGIGLENLNNRCSLLTNTNCTIEEEELFFTVKIPLIKNENYSN